MRKIREVLRLRAEGFSEREIARGVGCARSSVQICLWRAEKAGVAWPLRPDQDEASLEGLLYPRRPPGVEVHPTPDFEWVERELKRKHVTRRQLWREYLARYPEGLKYTAFCVKFQAWRRSRAVTLVLTHIPGDQLFVDYAGDPVPFTDRTTGLEQRAWLFVAVWPYSAKLYAEATRTQTSADWLGAHVRALEAFGCARSGSRQLFDRGEEGAALRPAVQSQLRRTCRTLFSRSTPGACKKTSRQGLRFILSPVRNVEK
jgi:transposase